MQADLEEQRSIWSSQERKVIAAMDNYLEKCHEAEVCLRYILTHPKRTGSRIFEIFGTIEKNDHLVASSSVGWSTKDIW